MLNLSGCLIAADFLPIFENILGNKKPAPFLGPVTQQRRRSRLYLFAHVDKNIHEKNNDQCNRSQLRCARQAVKDSDKFTHEPMQAKS
jgi:hypothetical protein